MNLPESFPPLSSSARDVCCFSCGADNHVPVDAVTLHCTRCSKPIDLSDYSIDGMSNRKIQTYGEVTIGIRGKYAGSKLKAGRLIVLGALEAQFECDELVVGKFALVTSEGTARALYVLTGGKVKLPGTFRLAEAHIYGELEVEALKAEGILAVYKGGSLVSDIEASSVKVERGAYFEGNIVVIPPPKPEIPVEAPPAAELPADEEKIVPAEETLSGQA